MTREINGQFKKGHTKVGGFGKGDKHSEKSLAQLSLSMRGNKNRWRGDAASYVAKHMWIVKTYGKANRCQNRVCVYPKKVNRGRETRLAPRRYEWANISGKHLRQRSDYLQLCPSCHRKWDLGKIQIYV